MNTENKDLIALANSVHPSNAIFTEDLHNDLCSFCLTAQPCQQCSQRQGRRGQSSARWCCSWTHASVEGGGPTSWYPGRWDRWDTKEYTRTSNTTPQHKQQQQQRQQQIHRLHVQSSQRIPSKYMPEKTLPKGIAGSVVSVSLSSPKNKPLIESQKES